MKRATLFVIAFLFCHMANAEREHPNIILILADDLDREAIVYMPKLNALLAARGVTFSNYFVNVANCCPSRASLLLGQYAQNSHVYTNRPPNGGFPKFQQEGHEQSNIATWLHAAGYKTALFGKYLNWYPGSNRTYVPPGWDEWYSVIRGHYYNYDMNENGRVIAYGHKEEDYETDVLSRKVNDFITRNASHAPVFAYVAVFAPHLPATAANRHREEFAGAQAPHPPSFNECDLSDKPRQFRKLECLHGEETERIDERYQARLQSLLAVDDMIADIFNTLRETGELDNSYIFFTSDNGFHQGEHRISKGKNTPYDEANNVPLIVSGPDIHQGVTLDHLVQNVDLAPTFAELGGAKISSVVDGRSIVEILKGEVSQKNWRQAALIQHWKNKDQPDKPDYIGLRSPSYLFVLYDTKEKELYDMRNDHYQIESVHAKSDPKLLESLQNQLELLSRCAGADCFITKSP